MKSKLNMNYTIYVYVACVNVVRNYFREIKLVL